MSVEVAEERSDGIPFEFSDESTSVNTAFPYEKSTQLHLQGAEARLHKCTYLGKPAVIKERFIKRYRHPILDKRLTIERLRNEMKSILRCKEAGIDVPTLYFHNAQTNAIVFEEIEGCSVKDYLASVDLETQKEDVLRIARSTGTVIGKLHQLNIAHGDLTTSNVMLRDRNPDKVVLIDFGLSTNRTTPEDFGVDLYVLERAVKSTHVEMDYFTDEILSAYGASWKGAKAALNKLAEVRLRGRKREIVG